MERAARRCEIWGVLNVTPDSFSDGGEHLGFERALEHGSALLRDGAEVVDVGGASSRPRGATYGGGAARVPVDEELHRVVPVVARLVADHGARVSVDTVHAEVAEAALRAGACIVNDVSCGRSRELLEVVARHRAGLVLMHTRGDGAVEPPNTVYRHVAREVCAELEDAASRALAAGVARGRLWLDPGLGFAKTAEQSLALLASIERVVALGFPVLVGPSRKAFLAHVAPWHDGGAPGPREREHGTAVAVARAVRGGARAVRVHDVRGMRQALLVEEALRAVESPTEPREISA